MTQNIPIPDGLPQLASQTTPEHPWPLRLLSAKIAEYVAKMSRLWVEGEVVTFVKRPGSKIQYFSVADLEDKVSINCKAWTHIIPQGLEPGSRIIIAAKPEFWTGNGSLSLMADEIRLVGIGDLLARIALLKDQLAREGLFDASRKQPLPFLPRKIGLICGRNTKAKDDVVVNASARWPEAVFEIREVLVQGPGAVDAMIPALKDLDQIPDVDVIVFARGGGSVEDLLPFSDERLVRAVAAAKTPVVSAIGHEADNPILDFVADFRASTPTDAAKRIVPDVAEERAGLQDAKRRGRIAVDRLISREFDALANLRTRPVLARPEEMIETRADDVANLRNWSRTHIARVIDSETADLRGDLHRLRTLSPRSTLKRGYAVLRQDDGVPIKHISDVSSGDTLSALIFDGSLDLSVVGIRESEM